MAELVRTHGEIFLRLNVFESDRLATHEISLHFPKVSVVLSHVRRHLLVVRQRRAVKVRMEPHTCGHVTKNYNVATLDWTSVNVCTLRLAIKRLQQPVVIVVFASLEPRHRLLPRAGAVIDLV